MEFLKLITSESVSEGHPDKIADQISDAILDEVIRQDPDGRVACETLVKTGMVLIAGELMTHAWADVEAIARKTVLDIGYNHSDMGFDGASCAVLSAIGKQSSDIAVGVDETQEHPLGAGDQGMMVGFACRESKDYLPAPLSCAHRLMKKQSELRKNGQLAWLRPDAKAQVTLEYHEGLPKRAHTVVVSTQHDPDISLEQIKEAVIEEIVKATLPSDWLDKTNYLINPTGRFVIGGPLGDCGLTGRKLMVDSYGGLARHGGGCFSGKDPTKVDRTGAYFARYIAKNMVAAEIADKVELSLSFAIGTPLPISMDVECFGHTKIPELELVKKLQNEIDFSVQGMIRQLDLKRPIFQKTASYGHFGRDDIDLPWERLDLVPLMRKWL